MKKRVISIVDKLTEKVLSFNSNSTTSVTAYQPKQPVEAKKFNRTNNK